LHAGASSKPPAAPAGVTRLRVAFDTGKEPARDEVFLAGSERALQRATAEVEGARRFGITSPRDGSVFAIDPDIPPAAQRITFEGEHGRWVLDGKALGTAERWRWAPWPGRHRLVLVGRDNQELQSVSFEVRGAGVKAEARPPAARGSARTQPAPAAASKAKPAPPAPAKPAS
jgi:penicillin-binding protein 1C